MIIYKFKVVRLLGLTIMLLAFLAPQNIEAQKKKKKKKGDTEMPANPDPKKEKEKKISDLIKSSKEINGLFKIYQDTITGSLQMIISKDQINKEFIHFNQIANGVVDAGSFRGAYGGSKVFKINK